MATQLPEARAPKSNKGFEQFMRNGVARRGAFPFLVVSTLTIAVGAGVLARISAESDFETFGDGIWWALVTLTTVGYGDIVPKTPIGRMIGAFVMVLGVTFLSFLTANVTSLFIASEEGEREINRIDRENEVRAMLRRIEDRLAAIEARLDNRT